jgi:hypothetical protein
MKCAAGPVLILLSCVLVGRREVCTTAKAVTSGVCSCAHSFLRPLELAAALLHLPPQMTMCGWRAASSGMCRTGAVM